MHSFKDTHGRAWNLEINCDVISQVKEQCGVNLIDITDPESGLMKELVVFPPLLCKFLFAALIDQAKAMKVEEREFYRAMAGDAISDAFDALQEELLLFSPRHRRKLLAEVLAKNREVEAAGVELMLMRLADPGLKQEALAAMDRKVRLQIEEALRELGPNGSTVRASGTGSSTNAGPPPGSCGSTGQGGGLGEPSNASPTGPGDPIAT